MHFNCEKARKSRISYKTQVPIGPSINMYWIAPFFMKVLELRYKKTPYRTAYFIQDNT